MYSNIVANIFALSLSFLTIGSVLTESNLKELCSKSYFDSIVVSYSTGYTDLHLTRKVDSIGRKYHLWDLQIDEKYKSFETKSVSYLWKENQTLNTTHNTTLSQPKECPINLDSYHKRITYDWILSDFFITNDAMNGPKVQYPKTSIKMNNKKFSTDKNQFMKSPLNSSRIWLSGLLCKKSDKNIFAFVEEIDSMNTSNRKQLVYWLRTQSLKTQISNNIIVPKPNFWLESMNKTVIEFLGIDCPNITDIIDTDDEVWLKTPTLYVMCCCLVISGLIFASIDSILIIKRQKLKIFTDLSSDVTSSPGQSTTKASASQFETNFSSQSHESNFIP